MAGDPDDTWRGMLGIVMIIVFLSILGGIAYLLYGPGITITIPSFLGPTTTEPASTTSEASLSQQYLAEQSGQMFNCEEGKALKAEFGETNVSLALSDGRALILSQNVDTNGEVQYTNADGSFAFLNTRNSVSVVENNVTTYKSCIAMQ